jgi:hypothetical protein
MWTGLAAAVGYHKMRIVLVSSSVDYFHMMTIVEELDQPVLLLLLLDCHHKKIVVEMWTGLVDYRHKKRFDLIELVFDYHRIVVVEMLIELAVGYYHMKKIELIGLVSLVDCFHMTIVVVVFDRRRLVALFDCHMIVAVDCRMTTIVMLLVLVSLAVACFHMK